MMLPLAAKILDGPPPRASAATALIAILYTLIVMELAADRAVPLQVVHFLILPPPIIPHRILENIFTLTIAATG